MEKLLNSSDKEYMKMAMLKQEEMFREQVYELHRLYRVQQILMKSIPGNRENGNNQQIWIKSNDNKFHNYNTKSHYIDQQRRQRLDYEQRAQEHIAKYDGDCVQVGDECEIELTLGPSSYKPRRKANPLTSDSGLSFSSSSTGSSHIKRKGSSNRINNKMKDEWGLVEVPKLSPSFLNSRRNSSSDINDQLRQAKLQQPPWLFQVLSMNIT